MRKIFYIASLCFALVIMSCSTKQENKASQSQDAPESITKEMPQEAPIDKEKTPSAAETSSKIIVIDFFATWCGPCKAMAPAMEQMQEKYGEKIVIRKIDVDEEPALAQQYQVQSIPTLVIISPSGEVIDKIVGAQPVETLDEIFSKLAAMKTE